MAQDDKGPVSVDYRHPPDPGASIRIDREYYPEPSGFRRELRRARPLYEAMSEAMGRVVGAARTGQALDPEPLLEPLGDLIASVIRHPDAMVWQRKLDTQPSYLTGHSVRVAVLAVVLARGMGFVETRLERAGLAGLLSQIGKTRLPRSLLEKATPTAEDLERIRAYVASGAEMVSGCYGLPQDVGHLVAHHQERYDGSGYPAGKAGDAIPLLSRIVGLADWYDAATTRKPHTAIVLSATDAMDELYRQRGVLFQHQVVEEFIRAMGIYPCGNFVLLNTGDVGLVQQQNHDHRTQPVILAVRSRAGKLFDSFDAIDLLEHNRNNPERALTIKRALAATEMDIDPNDVIGQASENRRGWRRLLGG